MAIVGGGQAGLAISHELTARGVEHLVLERRRIAQTWRDRWDSFCLVTPNWSVQLPGGCYDGSDPDGFMARDEIVGHLEAYAASFAAPVREGVEVKSVAAAPEGGFRLMTSEGELRAHCVVLCTGAFQRPHRPAAAASLPKGLVQIDAEDYRNPDALPTGKALVVGSGQTGCQIAEELHNAGRDVFLACGKAPWAPRRLEGRDIFAWSDEIGFLDGKVADLPSPAARLGANVQATGHDGGHDLHYRVLQAMGVVLLGHFGGCEGGRAHFAGDLAESVAFGDDRYRDLRDRIASFCAANDLQAPEMADPAPFAADAPDSLDLAGLGAVIFTSGFRPGYKSWVALDAFDEMGFPVQVDGESTVVPGLYFCGVHFLRKRKSSLLLGVGEDAASIADRIATEVDRGASLPLSSARPVDAG